jgi:hypothetical protein
MCSAKGDSSSVYATCGAGQFCDAAATTCRAQICAPGQPACDGNVATTCNAQGSGYEGGRTDCAPGGQLCAQGACRTLMCIPNSYFCNAGAVWRCSADGLTSASYQPCSATQFCDAMQAMCRAQICTPNQPACDGNVATTCNTEGSGYAGLRTDCTTSGDVCVQGSCADLVCSPNAYFCEMGAVRRCAADGLGSTVFQTCSASQYCDAASATCKARICTAGQPACDGTVATTCNADGSGYTGGRSDCAAVNQFCDRGTCVAEMPRVDVIGVLSTSAAVTGRAKLNFFSVATSRTLRQIEQYMAIATAGGTPMNFLVFESATQTGTYTQIFSVTVTLPVATGYQSSGPMSVPLVAGRYYAIGVQWGSLSATYYWEQVAPTQTTSFGALINADTITTTTPPTSVPWPAAVATYRYNQRLTTGP